VALVAEFNGQRPASTRGRPLKDDLQLCNSHRDMLHLHLDVHWLSVDAHVEVHPRHTVLWSEFRSADTPE
jgi:hypothetical protein